jgi:hypothetical protein
MTDDFNYPRLIFAISFFVLWLAAWVGFSVLRRLRRLDEGAQEDFGVILAATLTLLGLIIGFSFSMAIGRYDQRKNLEADEANAIGTEFVRADLLPAADAANLRALLKRYVEQRLEFYTTRDAVRLRQVGADTERLQTDMWSVVRTPALARPDAIVALAVSGMNDVLNAQESARAAWRNRIPHAAWGLMAIIAICCNLLFGYGARNLEGHRFLLFVLPFVVSIAFLLIADIDSPRGGLIHVYPQNLLDLAEALRGQ